MTSKTLKFPPDSEEARVKREVDEEEDFSTRIINSTTDGILAYDRNLTYTIWNPSMERMTGLKASEVVGHNALIIFPDLEKQGYAQFFARVLAGESMRDDRTILIAQTGVTVEAQRHHSPLRDERGEIVGGLAIVRDVTEQKHLVRQLKLLNDTLEVNVKQRTHELEAVVKDLAQQIAERQRAAESLKFIADAGLVFCDCLDYDVLVKNSLTLIAKHFSALCVIRIRHADGSVDRKFAHVDPEQEKQFQKYSAKFPIRAESEPNPFTAMDLGRTQWTPYITDAILKEYCVDPAQYEELKKFKFKSYLIVPITSQGKVLGTISILSPMRHLDSDDVRVVEDLAGRFAMALTNVQMIVSLKNRAQSAGA